MEKAIESYWAHKIDKAELDQTLTDLHKENLLLQKLQFRQYPCRRFLII